MSDAWAWVVLEGYRDGTTWTHHFHTYPEASWAVDRMSDRNPFREYVIMPADKSKDPDHG